jgi:hypothetical protein
MIQLLIWVVLAVMAYFVGREIGKRWFGVKKDVSGMRRSAQQLAIVLREHGLRRLPTMLEAFVVGDVDDLFDDIKTFAEMVKMGNEAIVKELEGTFDRMLGVKLNSPEGRALIKARVEAAEKVALEVAKAAAPIVAAAAIAAL